MFAMSGDGVDDVQVPSVFLYTREKNILLKAISSNPDLEVRPNKKIECVCEKLNANVRFFSLQISIMQMTGLKKRLESTLSTDDKV